MSSRRVLKAAEAIREVVSMAILTDLRDPRIENVTVTHVEVSPDSIDTRYTPRLQFVIDEGVKKSLAISQLLSELLPKENAPPDEESAETIADDED
jgi:ribosome-binding factor A